MTQILFGITPIASNVLYTAITPMVLTSPRIRDDVWSTGLQENEDVMIRVRDPVCMTEELFHGCLMNVHVPCI
jgi:hypothetical protein